jgi:hypothetical protein
MTACAKASGASCGRLCPAARDQSVLVLADVLLGIDARVSMRRAVRVTSNVIAGKEIVGNVAILASSSSYFDSPCSRHVPTVIVERDVNEIRVFEGLRRAFKGCVVECPSWGGKLPDQAVEVLGVIRIARFAALGGEIEHVPREFRARRQPVGGRSFWGRSRELYGSPGLNGGSLPGGTASSAMASSIATVT